LHVTMYQTHKRRFWHTRSKIRSTVGRQFRRPRHKLSLVWLGYKLGELAPIRSNNIGAERVPDASADLELARQLTSALGSLRQLPQRVQRMINRYVLDLHSMISEVYRVLRVGGKAIFVVGNSCIKEVFVRNELAVRAIAERVGLQFEEDATRDLPPSR